MPLSEHEQRLLEQLERQLHASDPELASSLSSDRARTLSARNIVLGVLVGLAGLMMLLFGIGTQQILLGVAGFLLMGAGVYIATISRGKNGFRQSSEASSKPRSKTGFMANLERKWEKRNREG